KKLMMPREITNLADAAQSANFKPVILRSAKRVSKDARPGWWPSPFETAALRPPQGDGSRNEQPAATLSRRLTMQTQMEKAETFRALHARPGAFIIPNPWDAGTAKLLAAMGFEALATTSLGLANALGSATVSLDAI